MVFRVTLVCFLAAAFAGATTINFDDINATGGNVSLNNQYAGVTFGSDVSGTDGCTNGSGCGFVAVDDNVVGAGVMTASADNFAAVKGNAGASVTMSFSGPVTFNSIDLLGLNANSSGFYDGATVTFYNGSSVITTETVNPLGPNSTSTAIAPSTMLFNIGDVTSVVFSKTQNPAGDAMFAFDNLTFTTSAVPEPTSMFLFGGGMIALGLVRRARQKRV